VAQTLVGYARCGADRQDLAAQRRALAGLGVRGDQVYLDRGYVGRDHQRPKLSEALAAVRSGDRFVVTKLDRLARSVPDAIAILSHLCERGVLFAMGSSIYDWQDPSGLMFLQDLAVVADFEASLATMRTREGMAVAKAKGNLKGRGPKLSPSKQAHLAKLHAAGEHTISELAELFSVSRPTVYRVLTRQGA
jgi:DNA invertase Pin-like site-specific DNA recombinase